MIDPITADEDIYALEGRLLAPFTAVVHLNPQSSRGSGFVVGPNLILTAWHVVEDFNQVEINIGWDGSSATHILTSNDVSQRENRDFALIKLEEDISKGTGSFGCIAMEDSSLLDYPVSVAGYPLGGPIDVDNGKIDRHWPQNFHHRAWTDEGQSGGPVTSQQDTSLCIGIHRAHFSNNRNAVRFTEEDLSWIQSFI